MSAAGRAVEFLDDWREGFGELHQHEWGVDCRACTAEAFDTWGALVHAAQIVGWLPPEEQR